VQRVAPRRAHRDLDTHLPTIAGAGWPVLARSSARGPESIDGARHDESYTLSIGVGSGKSGYPRSGKSGHLNKGARDGETKA
jgi:hypothetical protein